MRIGCCTTMENYEDLCKIVYDYIELSAYDVFNMTNEDFDTTLSKIKEYGIPCLGFNAYCRSNLPMVGPGFDENRVKYYAEKVCDRGASLGIDFIGIGSPLARIVPEGWDINKADMQMERFLRITAEVARQYGHTILFEALNSNICNYITSTKEALEIVEKLNIPNLKMVLDFYHMGIMGESIDDIGYVMHKVKHLHISHIGTGSTRGYLNEDDLQYVCRVIDTVRFHGYDNTISIETNDTSAFYDKAKLNYEVMSKACE